MTVAAVIERAGRFLLIEEQDKDRQVSGPTVFNQPAGHWEPGETLIEACAREALEESAHAFAPRAVVGVYRWRPPSSEITYLRFAFCGDVGEKDTDRTLDEGIVRTLWMTPAEIRATRERHRSPLLLRCVEDFLAGKRYPLDLITHVD